MRQYFEAEMRLLHEALQTFSEAYPEQARLLNLQTHRDRDPSVERLLEGFAYLTAHIKQRINDQLPDISANLLTQFWPQLLRPYPSTMITQFKYKPGQLHQTYNMPAQTLLKTSALGEEQIVCQFSTVFPVKIQPLQVTTVQVQTAHKEMTIKIYIQGDINVAINQLDLQDLILYINAEMNITLNLLYVLTRQVKMISVVVPRERSSPISFPRCAVTIKPCNLNLQDSILPNCHRTFSGFSLLLDYFCFREKYFFVSIDGLHKILWPPHTKQFIIEIVCNAEFAIDYAVSEKNLLLNCVPTVNLFKSTSEPIQINHLHTEYPLIVDSVSCKGTQCFSVDTVQGIETLSGKKFQYEPLYNFKFLKSPARYYSLMYQDRNADLLQPYLIINEHPVTQSEILSCNITVCNGNYARRYLCEYTELGIVNIPASFTAYNITRPTTILYPPRKTEWQWLLISHLSLNYNTLGNVTILHQLLQTYCWTNDNDNLRRISSIQQIDIRPIKKIYKGVLLQGIMFSMAIDETTFLSITDIHLFGEVMQRFLSGYVQFNSYVQLKIICLPSQRELIWKMTSGSNPLI